MSTLKNVIDESDRHPRDGQYQQRAIQECFKHLGANPNKHFFCDPDMLLAASQLLILFSLDPDVSSNWYKQKTSVYLSECSSCVVKFHQGRCQLIRRFLEVRRIPYKQVRDFNMKILEWDAARLAEAVVRLLHKVERKVELDTISFLCLFECLIAPSAIRVNSTLEQVFPVAAALTIRNGSFSPPPQLFPALMTIIFDLKSGEHRQTLISWATKVLAHVSNIESDAWDDLVSSEFLHYFIPLQDRSSFTNSKCIYFWVGFKLFLPKLTSDTIKQKLLHQIPMLPLDQRELPYPVHGIIDVLLEQIFARLQEPLPVLLSALTMMVTKFDGEFWRIIRPNSCLNVVDAIFMNNHYHNFLITPIPSLGQNSYYNLNDLLNWAPAVYSSLKDSPTEQGAIGLKIATFLFSKVHDGVNNHQIVKTALTILAQCSSLNDTVPYAKVHLELVSKVDCRAFINRSSQIIFAILYHRDSDQLHIRHAALTVIKNALKYDLLYYITKSYHIKNITGIVVPSLAFNHQFWKNLTSYVENHTFCLGEIMGSFANLCSISIIDKAVFLAENNLEIGDRKVQSSLKEIEQYNSEVTTFAKSICEILDVLSTRSASLLKKLINTSNSALGLWSCILSHDAQIYQSTMNLIYNALDVEGRLEGMKILLTTNPYIVLQSFTALLPFIVSNGTYTPFPRIVRLLMDIVKSLTEPSYGSLSKAEYDAEGKTAAALFWSANWKFLDYVYQKTLQWASDSSNEESLIDFARDTLELSHMLVDGYLLFKKNSAASPLYDDIVRVTPHMLVWLKLGDEALLSSCVDLVFKTLDLTEKEEIVLDSSVFEAMAKYGVRAKKFNNKLSEKQRMDILDRARFFDNDAVEKVVTEAKASRSNTPSVDPITDTEGNRRTPPPNDYNPSAENQRSGQSLLSQFLQKQNAAPKAPAPLSANIRLSGLQKVKQSLAAKRSPTLQGVAPAPPRAPGFNRSKESSVGASDRDSDSDSDEDDGVQSLFHPETIKVIKKNDTPRLSLQHKKFRTKPPVKRLDAVEQAAQAMRQRLNVDPNPFYREALSWSYWRSSDYPVDSPAAAESYKRVPDKFNTTEDYAKVFQPLLMLECWQAIQQSKQIGEEVPFKFMVGNRVTADAFFDVYASIRKEVLQRVRLGDSDLIVLCFEPKITGLIDHNSSQAADLIKSSKMTCLAKIRDIKSVNADISDLTLRVISRSNPLTAFLTPQTELYGMKVMQMITVEREYSALKGLQYYDLSKQIVQAVPNKLASISDSEKLRIKNQYDLNDSQTGAIAGSVGSNGFSLIQGPPGTGKTKTILGIISYILSSPKSTDTKTIAVKGVNSTNKPKSNKTILVCAPSNAAVDELVLRLKGGIKGAEGKTFSPNVVRLGKSDAINVAVKDLTLEELVDAELNSREGLEEQNADPKIREEHTKCVAERNRIQEELKLDIPTDRKEELRLTLKAVIQRKNELGKQLDDQRERIAKSSRTREIERRALQAKFLTEAQVICSTLSGSAHDVLAGLSLTLDTVVIDEAAQCTELSAIIPLRYGCKNCIMVGDPNQLPPTVLSQAAAGLNYEQSLFVRMQKQHPESVYMLNVQYRMHPDISKFPSAEFYNSKLIDGPAMAQINDRPWHRSPAFKPYLFYDVKGKQSQSEKAKSYFNMTEAKLALELVSKLFRDYESENWSGKIGIISPYKEQIRMMKSVFAKDFGANILRSIDFNTVDGFQGQEKEVIIMSCVRAEKSGIGFVSDVRRMNVALTRSRTSLWILGSSIALNQNRVWADLIKDAKIRNLLFEVQSGGFERSSTFLSSSPYTPSPPVQKINAAHKGNDSVPAKSSGHVPVPTSIGHLPLKPSLKDKSAPPVVRKPVVPYKSKRPNLLTSASITKVNKAANTYKEESSKVENASTTAAAIKSSHDGKRVDQSGKHQITQKSQIENDNDNDTRTAPAADMDYGTISETSTPKDASVKKTLDVATQDPRLALRSSRQKRSSSAANFDIMLQPKKQDKDTKDSHLANAADQTLAGKTTVVAPSVEKGFSHTASSPLPPPLSPPPPTPPPPPPSAADLASDGKAHVPPPIPTFISEIASPNSIATDQVKDAGVVERKVPLSLDGTAEAEKNSYLQFNESMSGNMGQPPNHNTRDDSATQKSESSGSTHQGDNADKLHSQPAGATNHQLGANGFFSGSPGDANQVGVTNEAVSAPTFEVNASGDASQSVADGSVARTSSGDYGESIIFFKSRGKERSSDSSSESRPPPTAPREYSGTRKYRDYSSSSSASTGYIHNRYDYQSRSKPYNGHNKEYRASTENANPSSQVLQQNSMAQRLSGFHENVESSVRAPANRSLPPSAVGAHMPKGPKAYSSGSPVPTAPRGSNRPYSGREKAGRGKPSRRKSGRGNFGRGDSSRESYY